MKALGIPNSRHFFGVTHIEDAKRREPAVAHPVSGDRKLLRSRSPHGSTVRACVRAW